MVRKAQQRDAGKLLAYIPRVVLAAGIDHQNLKTVAILGALQRLKGAAKLRGLIVGDENRGGFRRGRRLGWKSCIHASRTDHSAPRGSPPRIAEALLCPTRWVIPRHARFAVSICFPAPRLPYGRITLSRSSAPPSRRGK